MQVAVKRMGVEYQADFAVPLFDLADRSTEVLRCFHGGFSSKYPIRSEDMWISKGVQLSEPRVGIDVFGGYGLIDLTADRLSVSFKSLQNERQARICRDCIALGERALKKIFPDLTVSAVAFKLTLPFQLDEAATSADQYLSQVAVPSFKGDLDAFGSVRTHSRVNLDLDNGEEGWRALFAAHGRARDPLQLSVSCRHHYSEGTAIRSLEDKLLHTERLLSTFLSGIGLDVANPLFGMGEAE